MKLGHLINLTAVQAFCDSAKRSPQMFADAPGTILARHLTVVDPTIFERKYPELALFAAGLEADNTGGYAADIQSLRVDEKGGFTTAGNKSANRGRITLAGEESKLGVVEREAESGWTETEIKQAELGNINLPQRYLASHNAIYMRELDEIGLVGKDTITEGLLNHSAFVSGSASGAIGSLTAEQMYDEIATLITDQRDNVNNTPEYSANRVLMPTDVMNILKLTILNTAAGSATVMTALMANFPDVQFFATFRGKDVGGTSATVAYNNNQEVMKFRVPVPLTIGEIIKQGSFNYKVDSMYRVAGLDVLEPAGGRILTGL